MEISTFTRLHLPMAMKVIERQRESERYDSVRRMASATGLTTFEVELSLDGLTRQLCQAVDRKLIQELMIGYDPPYPTGLGDSWCHASRHAVGMLQLMQAMEPKKEATSYLPDKWQNSIMRFEFGIKAHHLGLAETDILSSGRKETIWRE